jgi:hypothetical protein
MYYIRDTWASDSQKWLIYRHYQRLICLVGDKVNYPYVDRSLDGDANKPLHRPGASDNFEQRPIEVQLVILSYVKK